MRRWLWAVVVLLAGPGYAQVMNPKGIEVREEGVIQSGFAYSVDCTGAGVTCSQSGTGIWTLNVTGGGGGGAHDILSATHTDTVPGAVTRGDLIIGNATPLWDDLPIGSGGTFLRSDGTDPAWTAIGFSDLPAAAQGWTDSGGTVALTTIGDTVGIGEATPSAKLHVEDSSAAVLRLESSSGAGTYLRMFASAALGAQATIRMDSDFSLDPGVVYIQSGVPTTSDMTLAATNVQANVGGVLRTNKNTSSLSAGSLHLQHVWSGGGNPPTDFGAGQDFLASGFTGGTTTLARIRAAWETTQTNNTTDRDSYIQFWTDENDSLREIARFNSAGQLGIGTLGGLPTSAIHIQSTSATYTADQYSAGTGGPSFIFRKARGTTIAGATQVLTNDQLMNLGARGYHSGGAFSGTTGAIRFQAAEDFTSSAQGTNLRFRTTATGSTTDVERVQITDDGSVVLNASGSALSTSATDGFTYVPNTAGTPAGTPASFTGASPIVYDSTSTSIGRLYVWNGSAWVQVGDGGGGGGSGLEHPAVMSRASLTF